VGNSYIINRLDLSRKKQALFRPPDKSINNQAALHVIGQLFLDLSPLQIFHPDIKVFVLTKPKTLFNQKLTHFSLD